MAAFKQKNKFSQDFGRFVPRKNLYAEHAEKM